VRSILEILEDTTSLSTDLQITVFPGGCWSCPGSYHGLLHLGSAHAVRIVTYTYLFSLFSSMIHLQKQYALKMFDGLKQSETSNTNQAFQDTCRIQSHDTVTTEQISTKKRASKMHRIDPHNHLNTRFHELATTSCLGIIKASGVKLTFSRDGRGSNFPWRYASSWDKSNNALPSKNISPITHLIAQQRTTS
jgi:hypothetical protein